MMHFPFNGKKVVVHRSGTIKKGRLINVTRCRVAGSDVSVVRAANLHQATEDWTLRNLFYPAHQSPHLVEHVGRRTSDR